MTKQWFMLQENLWPHSAPMEMYSTDFGDALVERQLYSPGFVPFNCLNLSYKGINLSVTKR
jgi:hypothetical protein